MKERYYITSVGRLERNSDTLYFVQEGDRTPLPVNKIYDIFAGAGVSVTTGVFDLLAENEIALHIFSYNGAYRGTFLPPRPILSGKCHIEQAQTYLDDSERLDIASRFVQGAIENMRLTLRRYCDEECGTGSILSDHRENIGEQTTIPELMQHEGSARDAYYSCVDHCLPESFSFPSRSRQPPENPANSAMSYLNALVYASAVTEIYHTRLNQTISFLHEPHERRYSLSLDIAEIFKPLLADRLLLSLTRQGQLTPDDFESEGQAVLLTDDGKKTLRHAFDERLSTTRKHPGIGRSLSWRRWIRTECYQVTKHVLGLEQYQPTTVR
ncbi:type I-B CRISPR-associated endonuclease Cas1b [Halorussus lipolyticus]|uniref:type I-B CRISPR-associated endonuclease Cas1b n=1 Tax=Halorussus lipolyticus TaxID=3034024 RepID=UPI0023E82DE3|nr:type I-B CRISPR-associated endonuclease Cas1b [Halorussus sp. DT80]